LFYRLGDDDNDEPMLTGAGSIPRPRIPFFVPRTNFPNTSPEPT